MPINMTFLWKKHRADFALLILALFLYYFVLRAFYPGFLSADSIGQAGDAAYHTFNDHHPPFLSYVWSKFYPRWPGPQSMYSIHLALYWSGALMISWLVRPKNWKASVFILLLGLTPPILGLLSTVWKDVAMGVSVVFITGMLFSIEKKFGWIRFFLILPAFFYGMAVRYNAFPVFLPFGMWLCWILLGRYLWQKTSTKKILFSLGLGLLLTIAFQVGTSYVNQRVTVEHANYGPRAIMIHDMTGIAFRTQDWSTLTGMYYNTFSSFSIPGIYKHFKVCDAASLGLEMPWKTTIPPLDVVQKNWIQEIVKHPFAYLSHRTEVFLETLGIFPDWFETYFFGFENNTLGLKFRQLRLNRYVMAYLEPFKNTFLFRNFPYFLLMIALLVIAYKKRLHRETMLFLAVPASGIIYTLSYFPTSPGCTFRYLWCQTITALILSGVLYSYLRPLKQKGT